jgi:type IV secretion system protein VirB2
MHKFSTPVSPTSTSSRLRKLCDVAVIAAILVPCMAMAADTGLGGGSTCTLLTTVQTVLNGISIVVVTIAIIFAGYSIAFAHKRISEVAPVFIGAILIGAAGQIANLLLSSSVGSGACSATAMVTPHAVQQVAAVAQALLQNYA